ncbi:hypothetical protein SEA_EULA_30 [Microbacterium phage Eula]|uniref:hypothetical protein n=1 Tax=Microbacterium phage Eula TaxID=2926098 RepID=UPI00220E1DF7|nr:hypothetical protein QDW40_gp30 [Microbacterium phage Eula]YP_010753665.1 hypothetical protein QDW41_gp31 [Microbacterium phage QMacho]UVF61085.1 hypothetical protein SEA_EULA_30 [Microbacterium phage Eula]UYL86688.1 hypothetical protein SEA_QMACHO_31 [Microbacterium phage QMacho]
MGLGGGKGALTITDKALSVAIGEQVEKAMRKALWEDRQIRAGVHRELDYAELDA